MAEKLFQKPKVYDPTMAERVPQVNSKMQQMMDLGFDDIENTLGYQPEMEEKYGHIAEQLDWGRDLGWQFEFWKGGMVSMVTFILMLRNIVTL